MREQDIRPQDVFDEYLRLSAEDVRTYFTGERARTTCVACDSSDTQFQFHKNGFGFDRCRPCGTLFMNPRPALNEFVNFYSKSPSSEYWAREFFPRIMERRKELIFAPRAEKIRALLASRQFEPKVVMDVGAGHGLFLEEWRKRFPETACLAIEPSRDLAQICRQKGFEVLEEVAESAQSWWGKADLVVCFEVAEHAHDPVHLVGSLRKLLAPGGYLLLSGLGVDGFDIQMLWEHSKSVSPPHHINFPSVAGYEQIFRRVGFQEISVSTPGQLDLDIVRGAVSRDPKLPVGRFVELLLERGAAAAEQFQKFLVDNRLSSHTWVLARG